MQRQQKAKQNKKEERQTWSLTISKAAMLSHSLSTTRINPVFFFFFLYHPPPLLFQEQRKNKRKRTEMILFLIFYFKSFVSLCSPLRLIVRYAIWHVPKTFRQRNSNFKMKITAAISVWFVFLLLVQTDKMHKEKNRDVINRDSVCMSFVLLYI